MAPLKIRKSKGDSYQGQKSEQSTEQLLRHSHSSDIASLGILNSDEQSTESIDSWEEVQHEDDSMCSRGQSLDYPSLANRSWASSRANTVAAEFGHHSATCLDSPDRTTSSQSSLNSMSTHRLSTLTPHQDYQEPSTSHDISSRQFDASSAATSLCGADSDEEMPRDHVETGRGKGAGKKESKMSKREIEKMNKEERRWNATDAQVLEHLLLNKGSVRAWRAVARARGLCSLSDGCRCTDCQADYLEPAGLEEDAGLGAGAPMITDAFAHGVAPACQIL